MRTGGRSRLSAPSGPFIRWLCCTRSTRRWSPGWRPQPMSGSNGHSDGAPKPGGVWGAINRIPPVAVGQSRMGHDRDRGHPRRSNGLLRDGGRGCPRCDSNARWTGFERAHGTCPDLRRWVQLTVSGGESRRGAQYKIVESTTSLMLSTPSATTLQSTFGRLRVDGWITRQHGGGWPADCRDRSAARHLGASTQRHSGQCQALPLMPGGSAERGRTGPGLADDCSRQGPTGGSGANRESVGSVHDDTCFDVRALGHCAARCVIIAQWTRVRLVTVWLRLVRLRA